MRLFAVALAAMLMLLMCCVPAGAASAPRVFALAGSGESQLGGNGGPATDAGGEFRDVVPLAHGGFLVSGQVVRRIDAHGVITTVAGNGSSNYGEPLGDGGPATKASLEPEGLAVLPGGGFLVADATHGRVRLVNSRGVISTVAGTGAARSSGDGGPATSAGLLLPVALALLPGGGYLIADQRDNRVRKVDAHGFITTVAGTGAVRSSGDGGPATSAGVYGPTAVAVLPHGGFLIAEAYGRRVRRVDARGVITTVAGGSRSGSLIGTLGDGGPARLAILDEPSGLAVLPDGEFLFADPGVGRVRRVDNRGIISTVAGAPQAVRSGSVFWSTSPAGTPWSGLSDGLGGPATDALLAPAAAAVAADGSVLISERTHVLMLTTGRHPPLAVAIRPPTVLAGSIAVNVASSQPGRERIEVRSASDGRLLAARTRTVQAGVANFRLPRLPGGPLIVRVTLDGQGRLATDKTAIVSGHFLPVSLARAAVARRCCGGGPPVVPATRAKRAQEAEETAPSVISCHRFGPARVDCRWGWEGRCNEVTSAVLRNALVYLNETTSCVYSKHPSVQSPPLIAPLL